MIDVRGRCVRPTRGTGLAPHIRPLQPQCVGVHIKVPPQSTHFRHVPSAERITQSCWLVEYPVGAGSDKLFVPNSTTVSPVRIKRVKRSFNTVRPCTEFVAWENAVPYSSGNRL